MESTRKPTARILKIDSNGDGFITILWGTKPSTIRSSDVSFDRALDAYKAQDWDALYNAMNPALDFVKTYERENVAIINGQVTYKGSVVHSSLSRRILSCIEQGIPCDDLFLFLNNLMENPSEDSRNELYDFLEQSNIALTDRGTFVAYKGVRADYYSITSGKTKLLKGKVDAYGRIYNGIGEEIEMRREDVDSARRNECSYGLHAGTYTYADGFKGDGVLVLVEIHPKDVVSVPKDYNFAKMRVCAYKVIGHCVEAIEEVLVTVDHKANTVSGVSNVSRLHTLRDKSGRFVKAQEIGKSNIDFVKSRVCKL